MKEVLLKLDKFLNDYKISNMETIKSVIGLTPDEVSAIETRLVKEIARISQYTDTRYITTFVLEHDKGDHQFPVLAQISNIGNTLWLNTEQLQNKTAKPINVDSLRGRCQKAFKASKIETEISKILDKKFPSAMHYALSDAKNELVKLFLEV